MSCAESFQSFVAGAGTGVGATVVGVGAGAGAGAAGVGAATGAAGSVVGVDASRGVTIAIRMPIKVTIMTKPTTKKKKIGRKIIKNLKEHKKETVFYETVSFSICKRKVENWR